MILQIKNNKLFLPMGGFNNITSDTHSHSKYAVLITQNTNTVMMPIGNNFNLSSNQKNPMQVYLNGAIQVNGTHYIEIVDPLDNTKGIGVDFSPTDLLIDDVVIFEWVIDLSDVMMYKGEIDCSNNPNFPAASINEIFKISVAGKIGGNSGFDVEIGNMIFCVVNISPSGDYATVGSNWDIFSKIN